MRIAARQISRILCRSGKRFWPPGHAPKHLDVFRAYLEHLGLSNENNDARAQIYQLFMDDEFTEIGLADRGFYLTPAWMQLRKKVLRKYGKVCMKCGNTENIHVDHIKPRSLFPELELDFENMQVLCQTCNSAKSNRDYTDYRDRTLLKATQCT